MLKTTANKITAREIQAIIEGHEDILNDVMEMIKTNGDMTFHASDLQLFLNAFNDVAPDGQLLNFEVETEDDDGDMAITTYQRAGKGWKNITWEYDASPDLENLTSFCEWLAHIHNSIVDEFSEPDKSEADKMLIESIRLLVKLDNHVEDELPEWYSSSNLIAEINDFYVKAEEAGVIW